MNGNAFYSTALSGARHAFFTRAWGNGGFSQDIPEGELAKTREKMASHLEVASNKLICCYQVHSSDVITVEQEWRGCDAPKADAMVTNKKGIALGILTADCAPVLFADAHASVIGAAHAGWRGAVGDVLKNTIEAMEKLGADRSHICAAIGPCIGQLSYEVSAEFPVPFLSEDPKNDRFFTQGVKDGFYQFDLAGYIADKLKKLDIKRIDPPPADTCADPETFYSHRYSTLRKETREGNQLSAIAIATNH